MTKTRKKTKEQSPQDRALCAAFSKLSPEEMSLVRRDLHSCYQRKIALFQQLPDTKDKATILEELFRTFPNNPFTVARLTFYLAATNNPKARETYERLPVLCGTNGITLRTVETALTKAL